LTKSRLNFKRRGLIMRNFYSKKQIWNYTIFITLIILAGCGINSPGKNLGIEENNPVSVVTPDSGDISIYLTKVANSTPIPTATYFADMEITRTAEANAEEWLHMVASDPISFNIASGKYQLVELMAFWCEECRDLNPILKGLEKEWGDKVNFVFLNVDDPLNSENLNKLSRFNVVPQLVLLDGDGKIVKEWVGSVPAETIQKELEALP
jgi:thiol-disulfide isomerase/thioredoxin